MAGVGTDKRFVGSPRSYVNTPQAARTTQKLDGSMATDMSDNMETPSIQQLYDSSKVKHLPGKGRRGKAEFVDWGTKLYQLELELSYKTNEILVLQKKLQKYARELYPGGDSNKKSVVQTLQHQNENLRKRISTKERQIKWEQKRCRGLELELAAEKKTTKKLKREQTTNHKGVQTLPTNHEAVQVGKSDLKGQKTRTVMTQCAPTVVQITNTTKVTNDNGSPRESKISVTRRSTEHSSPKEPSMRTASSSTIVTRPPNLSYSSMHAKRDQYKKPEHVTVENKVRVEVVPKETAAEDRQVSSNVMSTTNDPSYLRNNYVPSKQGIKFASAMTIKERPEAAQERRDPLEMSITQEFDKENSVRTMVQSNRDFEIKQKPMLVSQNGQMISGVEHTSLPERLNSASYDHDSGRGSLMSDRGSPSSPIQVNHQPRNARVSFNQIPNGISPSSSFSASGQIYERNMPEYMTPQSYSQRCSSRKASDARFNTTAWEIYNRGSPNANPNGMVPYYLFRRSNEHDVKSMSREKPVFVHVSEIMMQR